MEIEAYAVQIGSALLIVLGVILLCFGKHYLGLLLGGVGVVLGYGITTMLVPFITTLTPIPVGYTLHLKIGISLLAGGLFYSFYQYTIRLSGAACAYLFVSWLHTALGEIGYHISESDASIATVILMVTSMIISIQLRSFFPILFSAIVGTSFITVGIQIITDGLFSFDDIRLALNPSSILAAVLLLIGVVFQHKAINSISSEKRAMERAAERARFAHSLEWEEAKKQGHQSYELYIQHKQRQQMQIEAKSKRRLIEPEPWHQ